MKRGFQRKIECYADRSHNILKTGVIEFFWCFSKHLSKHRCANKHIYIFYMRYKYWIIFEINSSARFLISMCNDVLLSLILVLLHSWIFRGEKAMLQLISKIGWTTITMAR